MKNSTELTEEIAKEFSVSSADEVKLRTKLLELKLSIMSEIKKEASLTFGDFRNKKDHPGIEYVNEFHKVFYTSQDIAGINNKQADDYDNQSEETRQRG